METRFNLPQTPFKTREEEMEHLRKVIEEKEKALEALNIKKDELAPARETLAEYKTYGDSQVLNKDFGISPHEVEKILTKLSPETHDVQISELVKLQRKEASKMRSRSSKR